MYSGQGLKTFLRKDRDEQVQISSKVYLKAVEVTEMQNCQEVLHVPEKCPFMYFTEKIGDTM